MTAPHNQHDVERATRFLAAQVAADDAPAPLAPPPAMLAAVAATLRKRKEARRRRTWLVGTALAASVLAAVGAGALLRHGSPSAKAAPQGEWIAVATPTSIPGDTRWLPQGAHIRTESASTTLSFHEVTQVNVHERSDVELVLQGRTNVLRLDEGSLSARVKKLTPDERFIVRTSDAEVEVRGTIFHVTVVPADPACGDGTTTRVSVDEGTVVVRRGGQEHAVHVGEAWPSCPRAAATAPELKAPLSPAVVPTPASTSASTGHASSSGGPEAASSLGTQNDRFARAMEQKKSGDSAGAVRTLDVLLREFPDGPLAESAFVERLKLLETTNPARARNEAKQYLRRYPHGFGRAHAEGLLGTAP